MSDAREIVQPRWKRRATEIAEAIGGNSAGVSSVSLDSNTITQLSQEIADAIALKTLDINIEKYSGVDYGTAGMPMQQGYSAVTGNKLPFHVDQQGTIDVNVTEFNHVSVDSRGLPVQAGRTTGTNALVPLVVNCPTVNNFPSGGTGGGLNMTDTTTAFKNALYGSGVPAANANMIHSVEVGTSNAINTTLRNANFPLAVDITRIRGTNVATSPAGVGAHFPIATYTSALNVSGAAVTFPSTMAVTLPVDANNVPIPLSVTESAPITTVAVQPALDANNATIPLSVTESAPVTTVAVQPALDANNVAIPLAVTETNPSSGGGGGGGGLNMTDTTTAFKNALYGVGATANTTVHEQVETAMDNALANATGISVTETAPTTGVQDVKIVGDETTGIIMSKTAPIRVSGVTQNSTAPYICDQKGAVGGLPVNNGGLTQFNYLVSNGDPYNTGWIIRVNGVDIYNQDITYGLSGPGTTQNNLIHLAPSSQTQSIIDKYHGRKVTLSSVANLWIVEPIQDVDVGAVLDVNIAAQTANLRVSEYPTTIQYSAQFGTVTHTNGAGLGAHTVTRSDGSTVTNQNVYYNNSWYNNVILGSAVFSASVTGTNGHWVVAQRDAL